MPGNDVIAGGRCGSRAVTVEEKTPFCPGIKSPEFGRRVARLASFHRLRNQRLRPAYGRREKALRQAQYKQRRETG